MIYVPLNGPGKRGAPKAPSARGWASEGYQGVDRDHGGWVGLRCDGLVVVDCDSEEAASLWRSIGTKTHEVKTPRGRHFYYRYTPGSPSGPAVDVMTGVDIRAGRGSQVVIPPTPGYEEIDTRKPAAFKPEWLRQASSTADVDMERDVEEWTTIPEGRRNDTMVALAGAFRRQGMAVELIYQALLGFNESICDPPLAHDEIETIARSTGRYEPQPDWSVEVEGAQTPIGDMNLDDLLLAMSSMTLPPPAEWFWKPYLPKGRLVLMDGSEGIGKGLMCAHIATLLTADERIGLWGSTEDDPEEDIQKRLLAAGYERGKSGEVFFFTVDPRLPQDIVALEHIIVETGAAFLILDPGRSFLAPPENVKGFSYNDEASIRPGLEALNRLAKRSGCTIIFVHHWNKNTQTTTQYRSGGTGAFAQVVRHRITLAWVGPTDGGEGAFEVSKSNIGPKGNVHTYYVEPVLDLDTARLALGTKVPEYADIAEWMKAKEDESKGVDLDNSEEVADAVLSLPPGSPVPTRTELMKQYGLKKTVAEHMLDEWEQAGVVRRGGRGGRQLFRADTENENHA